jgi:hypothetical protein
VTTLAWAEGSIFDWELSIKRTDYVESGPILSNKSPIFRTRSRNMAEEYFAEASKIEAKISVPKSH